MCHNFHVWMVFEQDSQESCNEHRRFQLSRIVIASHHLSCHPRHSILHPHERPKERWTVPHSYVDTLTMVPTHANTAILAHHVVPRHDNAESTQTSQE